LTINACLLIFTQYLMSMKSSFALLFATFFSLNSSGQNIDGESKLRGTEFGFHLNVDVPSRGVMPEMETTGLWGFSLAQSPMIGSPFYIEFKAMFGNYGSQTFRETYYLKNNLWYPAESYYKSGQQKYLLGPKVMIGNEVRTLRGFATPQIGLLRMRSRTLVKYWDGTTNWNNNNTNDDGSQQVTRTAVKQTSFVYGAEAGFELGLQSLFKKETNDNFKLQFSASFLRGFKEYRYANVDEMVGPEHFGDEGVDFSKYVLVSHPNAEEIKYVELFQSPLQMWGINLGFIITF
jgi:hypothetical protein